MRQDIERLLFILNLGHLNITSPGSPGNVICWIWARGYGGQKGTNKLSEYLRHRGWSITIEKNPINIYQLWDGRDLWDITHLSIQEIVELIQK